MKRIRLDRWASQLQPPRNPRLLVLHQRCPFSGEGTQNARRKAIHASSNQRRYVTTTRTTSSSMTMPLPSDLDELATTSSSRPDDQDNTSVNRPSLNAPHHRKALQSAKLAALHARLSLPSKLPLQTLARCLVDASVDPRPGYNNSPLAILGQELLGYYTAEWLMTRYPRIPMSVLFAAQYAYVGSQTLAALRAEWGVDVVAAPGPEVDPGLLQLQRVTPGNALAEDEMLRIKHMPQARRVGSGRKNERWDYRRGVSSRVVYDDQFGDLQTNLLSTADDTLPYPSAPLSKPDSDTLFNVPPPDTDDTQAADQTWYHRPDSSQVFANSDGTTVEAASTSFIRAVVGAIYLHAGTTSASEFHSQHITSRHLPLHTLFNFSHPTRDLSRLCAREGFEPPVARLISETGRLSRTPVFVVGVFSGDDKLGEGAGASLNEARVRAAAAALRAWYLYSPPEEEVMRPSEMEGRKDGEGRRWRSQAIDIGEIIT